MQLRRRPGRSPLARPQCRETLERDDSLARDRADRRDTRPDLLPVQQHRAGAALRESAPEARPVQMELVVQDVQERRIDARRHPMTEIVDSDRQGARHYVTLTSPFIPAAA